MDKTTHLILKGIGAILFSLVLWWTYKGVDVMALWFFLAAIIGIFLLAFPRKK